MGDEGKRRFEAFAKEHSFGGVEPDSAPVSGGMFRKKAALPESGAEVLNPAERSKTLVHAINEGIPLGGPHGRDHGRSTSVERPRRAERCEEGPQQSPGVGSPGRSSRSRKRRHEGDRTPRGEDRGGEPPRARPGRDEKGDEAHPPVSRTGRTRSEGTVASRGSKKSAPELPKKEVNPFHPAKVGYEEKSQVFRKHALPPSDEQSVEGSEEEDSKADDPEVQEGTKIQGLTFGKQALAPELPVEPIAPVSADVVPKGGGSFGGSQLKEENMMIDYDIRTLQVYTELEKRGVEMEIQEILNPLEQDQWSEAFQSLVRPKKAATGMRYVRLMESFMEWVRKHEAAHEGSCLNPTGKDHLALPPRDDQIPHWEDDTEKLPPCASIFQ
eukprot:symbB.v1.2.039449.t1/scaffold6570.1/size16995/4